MSREDRQLTEMQPLVAQLQSDWGSVLDDEASADVELVVGAAETSERIAVHRLVLQARCAKLARQLRELEGANDGRPALSFPYLSPTAVRTVVRYLYTAKVAVEDVVSSICQLLAVCYAFDLPALRLHLLQNLNSWLTVDSVCSLLAAAHAARKAAACSSNGVTSPDLSLDMEAVVDICMDYIHSHVSAVLAAEGLLSLESDTVISILSSEKVSVEEVLKAVVKWGKKKAGVLTPLSNWSEEEREMVKEEVEQLLQQVDRELLGGAEGQGLRGLLERVEMFGSSGLPNGCQDREEFPHSDLLRGREEMQAQLHEWCGSPVEGWKLLYRASRDGYSGKDFHRHCDGKGPSVVITQSSDGCLFGGYTDVSWSSSHRRGKFISSHSAFLFSLINPANSLPTKMDISQPAYAINNHPNNGPIFGAGADLYISSDCHTREDSYSQLGCSYSCSEFPSLTLANSKYFCVEDYEVYGLNRDSN